MATDIDKKFSLLLDKQFSYDAQILQDFQPEQCQGQLQINTKYFQHNKILQQKDLK